MPFSQKEQAQLFTFISLIPEINLETMYTSFFVDQEMLKAANG